MPNVSIIIDAKSATVAAGKFSQAYLVKMTTPTTNAVPRLNIRALNQKFSAGDNVTIAGGEVITSSLS